MKQIGKRILTGIMMALCALCLVLAACGETSAVKFEFETNGGAPIEAVTVEKGETYTLPTPEPREAYSFEGWFDNAEFSGDAVTEVTAETDKKFYAKWEQLYEIVLDLDGGTLSEAKKIFVKEGASVSEAVKDLVPQKSGWQFGAWYVGDERLLPSLQMKAEALQLTARYKVGYTVEIFEQNLDTDGYTKADDYVGYEYITGTSFAPANAIVKKGFELAETQPEGAVVSKVLTETMANNTFRLYYDRLTQTVTVYPSYPGGGLAGEPKTYDDILFGSTLELPAGEFSKDGYFLSGWEIQNGGEERVLRSHYIDTLTINGNGADPDEITVDGDLAIFAQWSQGYTDMMRGGDVIYHFDEEDTVCYLERSGQFFEGTYTKASKSVTFRNDNGSTLMYGKLKDDNTFIYANDERADTVAQYYTLSDGRLHSEVQIFFQEDDTLRYDNNGSTSMGSYSIDDEGNYKIQFTSGNLKGQSMTIRVTQGSLNGSTINLFLIRNEDEYRMPVLQRAIVVVDPTTGQTTLAPASMFYDDDAMTLALDGYGNATLTVDDESYAFYYRFESGLLVLLNRSGSVYATYQIIEDVMGESCYLYYREDMDTTYIGPNGSTLHLNGIANATYDPGNGSSVGGYYRYTESVLGGYIVTMSLGGNQEYTFLIKPAAAQSDGGATTPGTFEIKPNNYAEYYYADDTSVYYAPFIVMNDDIETENRASIYGYTRQGQFIKVAEGSVEPDETEKTYTLTVDSHIKYAEEINTSPINLYGIKCVVFGVGAVEVSSGSMDVSYWYLMETEDGVTDEKYVKTYTGNYSPKEGEPQEVTLKIIGGFAVLKIGEEPLQIGMFWTDVDNITTIEIEVTEENRIRTVVYHVRLSEGEGAADGTVTFLTELLGSAGERLTDGTTNENVIFEFDGEGGAVLTTKQGEEETRVEGTVAETTPVDGLDATVYLFTPTDGGETQAFRFIIVTNVYTGASYFTRETQFDGVYNEQDGENTLNVSSLGVASYTVGSAEPLKGVYAVVGENIIRLDVDSESYFFRLIPDDKKFVQLGNEYGEYYFVTNASYDGYTLFLDGEGHATLKGAEGDSVDISGTYQKNAGVYELHLDFAAEEYAFPANYTGELGRVTVGSQTHDAFIAVYSSARKVYVDRSNWYVLALDGAGNAIRYGTYGTSERGRYIFVTEDLLYYENSADTDACLYRYSYDDEKGTGTIVRLDLENMGYYTSKLDSLRFLRYGFMVFNNTTRYYYDLDDEDNIILYRRDFDSPDSNDYGFRSIPIGNINDETLEFSGIEDFGSEIYYKADGYGIDFARSEEDKTEEGTEYEYKYPVYMDETEEDLKPYSIGTFKFVPLGSAEYSTSGTVIINGATRNCTVYREVVDGEPQLYFMLDDLRFDVDVEYGSTAATYSITGLRRVTTYQSNDYLSTYLYARLLMGITVPDTVGTISFITEFDETGHEIAEQKYITTDFLEDSPMYGTQLKNYPYTYEKERDLYCIELPAKEPSDGCTYKLYITVHLNSLSVLFGSRMSGYYIVAYTRAEELTTTDEKGTQFTISTERVLVSEASNLEPGDYFALTIKEGEEQTEVVHDVDITLSDCFYLISYTYDEPEEDEEVGKVLSAKYYKLVFTEKNNSEFDEQNTVKYLESVTVKVIDVKMYFTADHESYLEVLEGEGEEVEGAEREDLIIHFSRAVGGGVVEDLVVSDFTYDADTSTYNITTMNGRKFEIKVTSEENKTIEITEIEVYRTSGSSYVEMRPDEEGGKEIIHVNYVGRDYTVTECSYDEATKKYTVTTEEGKIFEVEITNEENKTITITDVTPSQP